MDTLSRLFDSARETGTALTFAVVLWAIIFGMIISWIIIFYDKKVVGAFVRAIIAAQATDESSAKTLSELGQENNPSAISHLRRSESLRRIVHFVGALAPQSGKKHSAKPVFDETTRFYIPESSLYRASKQYDAGGSELWKMIVGALSLFILGILLTYFSL